MLEIFNGISESSQEKIIKLLEANTYSFEEGANILSSVKEDNLIGFVEEGVLQITKNDYNGNKYVVENVEKNGVFGDVITPLFHGEYEITIKSESAKILVFNYNKLLTVSSSTDFYNNFIHNFIKAITHKIMEKNDKIEILSKRTIRDKLLEFFNICAKKYHSKSFEMPFSFTDLADYIAVDRSAMSRELSVLKEEGFVDVNKKKITLNY